MCGKANKVTDFATYSVKRLNKMAKLATPKRLIEAILDMINEEINLLKYEQRHKTFREEINADINTTSKIHQETREILNHIAHENIKDKELILNKLLYLIDKYIENPQILSFFSDIFIETLYKPTITKNDILKVQSILSKNQHVSVSKEL
ncbi:hypothetical protein [Persephonella sp.]